MKPRLWVGLVNAAAAINIVACMAAVIYGCYELQGYLDEQRTQKKYAEEQERNKPIGRVIPLHAVGSLTAPSTVISGGGYLTSTNWHSVVNLRGGGGGAFGDEVELKTDEELQVFNQWFYHTGANGTEYWTHNRKNYLPNPDGSYGKHFEVSKDEYIWMMQWKLRQQKETNENRTKTN